MPDLATVTIFNVVHEANGHRISLGIPASEWCCGENLSEREAGRGARDRRHLDKLLASVWRICCSSTSIYR